MHRGTTPTFTLTVPEGYSFDDASNVYVTLQQNSNTLTKSGSDLEISGNTVDVYLTQRDSLMFSPGTLSVQMNVTFPGGQRACTEIAKIAVKDNLLPQVLS